MKLAIFLAVAAVVPASAQLGTMKQAPPASVKTAGTMDVPLQTGGADPCNLLGQTRGIYVSGLGAIFTAEVELAATPGGVGLFQTTVGPAQKAKIHKDKLAHVPLLETALRDMALSLAASPSLRLSDTDQVVVAVRLVYRPWEDMTGLPGQILVRLDHRGGIPKVEVQ
jgi:hypothetical protein